VSLQPQYAARVRPEYVGLKLLVNAALGARNLVNGRQPPLSGEAGISYRGTVGGRGISFTGSQSNNIDWYTSGLLDGATEATFVCQLRLSALGGKPLCAWGTGGNRWLPFQIDSSTGAIIAAFVHSGGSTVENGVPGATFVANRTSTLVCRLVIGQTITLWMDGVKYTGVTTMGTAGGEISSGGAPATLGAATAEASSQINGQVLFASVANKAWPDQMCRELSINPWRIFRPSVFKAVPQEGGATSYSLTVDHAQGALAGQEIPFILTQPGSHAELAISGQDISLLADNDFTLAVDHGQAAAAGQDVTLTATFSYSLALDHAQMAFAGANVVLSYSGVVIAAYPRWFPFPLGEKVSWLRRYTGLADAAVSEANGNALWARYTLYRNIEIDIHSIPGYPRPNYTH
jgi:hypothetical protein